MQKQLSKASVRELRDRANAARDRLSRHRVMIDRYLPVYMFTTPADDVHNAVEYRVSQLYDRSAPHSSLATRSRISSPYRHGAVITKQFCSDL